jgi:hypothetical protein
VAMAELTLRLLPPSCLMVLNSSQERTSRKRESNATEELSLRVKAIRDSEVKQTIFETATQSQSQEQVIRNMIVHQACRKHIDTLRCSVCQRG